MNKKKKLIFLIVLLIIILGLISLFSFKTYNKYQMWDLHKDYFNQDESTQKIEDWMNIKSIESRFEVDFKNELNIDLSFYDKRKPLSTICIEENLDCKNIIRDLNKKYNLNDNSSGDNKK